MKHYEVCVIDRISFNEVTVGQKLSKAEAFWLKASLDSFNACNVVINETTWINKKGKVVK